MTSTETPVRRLVEELDELHAYYAQAVNEAIEVDDVATAEELAVAYDVDATRLVAEREGRTDMLPLVRRTRPTPARPDTSRRRLSARLRRVVAASDAHTIWAFNPPTSLDPRRPRR